LGSFIALSTEKEAWIEGELGGDCKYFNR